MKLYKVLVDGKSCHGGDFEWSLPKKVNGKWKPSKWHKIGGDIEICERGFHLTKERFNWYTVGCTAYEAEAKGIKLWQDDKCVCSQVRLLKRMRHPKWWNDTLKFIDEIKSIKYFSLSMSVKVEWKVFDTWAAALAAARDAASDAARDAAWAAAGAAARDALASAEAAAWAALASAEAAAWNAAGAAARDAGLYARCNIVCDKIDPKHMKHAEDRMEVWKRGYGLLCDVDGILYVYKKP